MYYRSGGAFLERFFFGDCVVLSLSGLVFARIAIFCVSFVGRCGVVRSGGFGLFSKPMPVGLAGLRTFTIVGLLGAIVHADRSFRTYAV